MVIILFKKTSFSSKTQTDWQFDFPLLFYCIDKQIKNKWYFIFTEIMDSSSPKKGASRSSKGKKYFFILIVVFVIAGDLSGPTVPIDALSALFQIIPTSCLSSIIFVQFFKIFALFVRNQTHTFTLLNRSCCYIIIYCEDIIIHCEELFHS